MSANLNDEETRILRQYLPFYVALATGERLPQTAAQFHFVDVARGKVEAASPHEHAFLKWRRLNQSVAKAARAAPLRPKLRSAEDWADWVKSSNSMFEGMERVNPNDDNWDPTAIH